MCIRDRLKAKRSSFGWWLTLSMMVVYYGFILLVAFNKEFPVSYTHLTLPTSDLV